MNILIPDSWLREYLETDAKPGDIQRCLSLCGPSVERISKAGQDYVYEIEITTNRIDTVSVYGIAREGAAILPRFGFRARLKPLDIKTPITPKTVLPMEVSDPQRICHRIMGVVMEVAAMKDSPDYIRERIEKSGVRALNNLVDVTNYVMLELGHPCHVFDYDRIKSHRFLIRHAKKNEPIITLDKRKYLLSEEDVIIDDGTGKVIDLPGIMGTENSVVVSGTRRIFFFIESNDPVFIRRTSMRYAIRTMAASINEKHPDPELVKTALFRGIELYQKLAGAEVAGKIIDLYPGKPQPGSVNVSVSFINERLGIQLKTAEIIDILKSLSFKISVKNNNLTVTPPGFRRFDISLPEDIIEEVARVYGYHNLPAKLMKGEIPNPDRPKILRYEEKIKTVLKYWGYTEVYNYSFISRDITEKALLITSDHLQVANPLTPEIEFMRISLVPSMLETVARNQSHSDNLQLFELANVYQPKKNSLPKEFPMLAVTSQKGFFELKGLVESILLDLGLRNIVTSPKISPDSALPSFWDKDQALSFSENGTVISVAGRIHTRIRDNFQIKKDVYLAVFDVGLIAETASEAKTYKPIPSYPPVIEDLSFTAPSGTKIGPVLDTIREADPLVSRISIIDRFMDKITLRIVFQSGEKTLTGPEIKKVREEIIRLLANEYSLKLKS